MNENLRIFSKVLSVFLIVLVLAASSLAQAPKKVAILPFTMNAQQDLTFLQEGIMDMLSSRLAWKDRLYVVEKPLVRSKAQEAGTPLDKEKALSIGRDLGTDYVILGSITVFGESVSLDAKILDVAKGEELITAFKQTKGMEDVIPAVNEFAEDINAKIMGRYVPPTVAARPEEPEAAGALLRVGESPGGRKVAHTQRFEMEILSLDVGDVDGDGQNEIVFVEQDNLYMYKWREQRFVQIQAVKEGWAPNYVWVSLGDLDGDNKAEVYLSNLSGTTVSSMVLEWQGNGLKKVVEKESWFLRVIDTPGQGQRLIGQKRQTDGAFRGDVYFLERNKDGLVQKEPLRLPGAANVFNYAILPVKDTTVPYTVLLDRYEKLCVYNSNGERIWRSNEQFGGSLNSLPTGSSGGMSKSYKAIPLPLPIFRADVDDDEQEELVIAQNQSRTMNLTDNYRDFTSGKVLFMKWDGVGLTEEWTSQKVQGAVAGYVIRDVDNDGLPELLVVSVTSQRFFVGVGKKSQIVVYDLK